MRIGILGAGPAGLAAAYTLCRHGLRPVVFEASREVGGMAKSFELWGQRVDLGPHRFFSSDRRVNQLWLEVVGRDYAMIDRLTRIFFRGECFAYPLSAADAALKLGLVETSRCVLSYLRDRGPAPAAESSFRDWVCHQFGSRLYELFFRGYSEKLWGVPCELLDADFARQRIRKFNLSEAIRGAIGLKYSDRHKTLVDRYAFPEGGTGSVYRKMADFIRSNGGEIRLGVPVRGLRVEGTRVAGILLEDGTPIALDHVISSIPLTLLVQGIPSVPDQVRSHAAALTFRNTILVYLLCAGENPFPDNWMYLNDGNLQAGRVTNFSNWGSGLKPLPDRHVLAVEYWCNDEDAMWTESDPSLVERARKELSATGLVRSAAIVEGTVRRVPRCYPVYRLGYRRHVAAVAEYLQSFAGLQVIGRYGSFKYNNQDHSLLMGMLAAENLYARRSHSLWNLNSDYTYQESALIDETGLVAA